MRWTGVEIVFSCRGTIKVCFHLWVPGCNRHPLPAGDGHPTPTYAAEHTDHSNIISVTGGSEDGA